MCLQESVCELVKDVGKLSIDAEEENDWWAISAWNFKREMGFWEATEKKDNYKRARTGQAKENLPSRECLWIS